MWIVGSVIFAVYMYFTIWNINNGVKPPPQREDASYDMMDMDGMGWYGWVEDGGRWWKVGWDWLWFIGNHCVGLRGCPKYHEQAKEPLI